ncbi:hypothetical protein L6164_034746 [Bauhinia variegata]|uniref:Uncharacterized protein n=1 Tax=Bauhinia variegata TaxID=167791 RepID=A0ACB9KX51_BAUVA|nr:hypothetical protein L6164_034746 [Bauhinia variegata]
MSGVKGNAEISDSSFSNHGQDDSVRQSSNNKESSNCDFGKALAYRALYGSSGHRNGSRSKPKSNDDARMLPSRLSKVSMADHN